MESTTEKRKSRGSGGTPCYGPDVPYIESHDEYGFASKKPLNPTGKWKFESGPYYRNKMFVQHKGWLLKHWISEDYIVFAPAKSSEEFICCPVCGYYCLGKGGHGCIDKPSMVKA